MSNKVHGLPLLSSWNILYDDVTLNGYAVNDRQLKSYLQKWDEQVKIFTNCNVSGRHLKGGDILESLLLREFI